MILIFQGADHIAKIRFKTGSRDLEVATQQTNNEFASLSVLTTNKQMKDINYYSSFMDDKGFEKYIIAEFGKMGYNLLRKENDEKN